MQTLSAQNTLVKFQRIATGSKMPRGNGTGYLLSAGVRGDFHVQGRAARPDQSICPCLSLEGFYSGAFEIRQRPTAASPLATVRYNSELETAERKGKANT
ncbi:hypothetical protein SAY87_021047 [Trapa incisa]|uniref:Uncharacterized protein n=1 Tax=Trapa incisa TaxID=236973 RepID=A0AAN7JQY1_9MYRT|nr:hypothetical protein SAY87_021047 [Trapa incisa]